ncbi:MAG: recombination protein NinB [Deltaproteobacteria bacterium]|nr:recombination protein NinB [Deltaproteobacteria bacterium]
MKKQTFITKTEEALKLAQEFVSSLHPSKKWEITVAEYRKKRSLGQNALMWKWANEVADYVSEHTGMDADDVHAFLKGKFLSPRIVEIKGEVVEYRTTTKLSTAEMTDYMNKIYAWATTDLGLILPHPDDLGRDDGR